MCHTISRVAGRCLDEAPTATARWLRVASAGLHRGERTYARGHQRTGRGTIEPAPATEAVCRIDLDRPRRQTTTHPTPPGGRRAVTGGTRNHRDTGLHRDTGEDLLFWLPVSPCSPVSPWWIRFSRRGGNVPCPITDRDTPEALCRKRDPGAAPQDRGIRRVRRFAQIRKLTKFFVFRNLRNLRNLRIAPARLCRTQGCQTDETGVSSTGRDSHDRLGGRVPPASDASDAQTRREGDA